MKTVEGYTMENFEVPSSSFWDIKKKNNLVTALVTDINDNIKQKRFSNSL